MIEYSIQSTYSLMGRQQFECEREVAECNSELFAYSDCM